MIAGPSGVGKSTMLSAGLPHGEIATADNICAATHAPPTGWWNRSGRRRPGRSGRAAWPPGGPAAGRVPCLDPDRLVVLGRAAAGEETTVRLAVAEAARALVAGTYMAGELRRFWPFAATLALATGIGPAHPDVSGVAAALADAAAVRRGARRARLAGADR